MFRSLRWGIIGFAAIGMARVSPLTAGCNFSSPSPTLSERLHSASVVYLVKPAVVRGADESVPRNRILWEVLRPLKTGRPHHLAGDFLETERTKLPEPGKSCALFGTFQESVGLVAWEVRDMTPAGERYLRDAPRLDPLEPDLARNERLSYFLRHLEHPDDIVAEDALEEIEREALAEGVRLADGLPREKLRAWMLSSDTKPERFHRYGLLLGLCGHSADADLLWRIIEQPSDQFRPGLEFLMFGYLLMAGEPGLSRLDDSKFRSKEVTFSEVYAAQVAIRLMWKHGQAQIPPERLRASTRLLLDRPELADLAIADLARMEDWTVQDRLMELYGTPNFDIPSVKRAIVRFMLASANFVPLTRDPPEHVAKGRRHLAELERRDPKTVKDARRFWKHK